MILLVGLDQKEQGQSISGDSAFLIALVDILKMGGKMANELQLLLFVLGRFEGEQAFQF